MYSGSSLISEPSIRKLALRATVGPCVLRFHGKCFDLASACVWEAGGSDFHRWNVAQCGTGVSNLATFVSALEKGGDNVGLLMTMDNHSELVVVPSSSSPSPSPSPASSSS